MNKPTTFLIGPELFWVVLYLMVIAIARLTHSPAKGMDPLWLSTTYIIPLVLIPLSFGLYYFPGVIRDWLLLRLWIGGLVGGHFVMARALIAHSEQGPGVGTAYIMGMGFALFALIAGSIWAVLKF
jgi:hypothetical protein